MHRSARRNLIFLIGLMIIVSLAEVFSIGAVVPFLGVLINPEKIFNYEIIKEISSYFGFINPNQIILPITILFATAAIFAALMRLFLLWMNSKFVFNLGKDIGYKLFFNVLYQPYDVHINRNSSEIINIISSKVNSLIYSGIMQSINFITSIIMLSFIISGLLYFNFKISLISFLLFGSIYFLIIKFSRIKLYNNGLIISNSSSQSIKILQEGLGGIRDIIIDNSQNAFLSSYRANDASLRDAQSKNTFISSSPRFLIEGIGTVLISILAYFLAKNEGSDLPIATLGVLALGAQRLMPVLQQAYWSLTEFRGNQESFNDVMRLLKESTPHPSCGKDDELLVFNEKLAFKDAAFGYGKNHDQVISGINITVKKGERIGIIGKTGSGKSTFIDLLMGLLTLSKGVIEIDDRPINVGLIKSWQRHLTHVPQSIFLRDASIAENIAFGIDKAEINYDLLKKVAIDSQLMDVIHKLPLGFDAQVGERGVRLSGGQRQRIGIARALYKNADVIVLDEATSALDDETETSLMDCIYSLDKNLTIFIIAHRLSTLKKCDRIFEIRDGQLFEVSIST